MISTQSLNTPSALALNSSNVADDMPPATSQWLKEALKSAAGYQAIIKMFFAMSAEWYEKRLIRAMDKTAKDMEKHNEYEAYKGKIEILVSELAANPGNTEIQLPSDISAWLRKEDIYFKGDSLNMSQLKTLVIDIQKLSSGFGDRNTQNQLECQQSMSALNALLEECKGFNKRSIDLIESINRATYGS